MAHRGPPELCENLRDDAGLVLQGLPLSSLKTVGPPTSDNLAVFWLWDHVNGLLFQLAHGELLG